MRLIHIVPEVERNDAGPSHSVPGLCRALAEQGHRVELSCLGARGEIPGVRLDIHRSWPVARRFAISTSHARALGRASHHADVVHNHSLWSMINVAAGWVVPGKRAKLVNAPHGTLSPWALRRSRHLKRLMRPLQWRALHRADLLHATSEAECEHIREAGFDAPVVVIPNGVDLPASEAGGPERSAGPRTLLYLSRIHPIKGVDRLLHAWRALQATHDDWRLVVAGPGDAPYVKEVRDLTRALNLDRVVFPGPLYGDAKTAAFARASLFVLPTHSENFGMAIAEALAHGCPVVVSKGAPWRGVEAEGCGWWTGNDVEELAGTLDAAMRLGPDVLARMGRNGRAWMARDYAWARIAGNMTAAYEWLLGNAGPPSCLRS